VIVAHGGLRNLGQTERGKPKIVENSCGDTGRRRFQGVLGLVFPKRAAHPFWWGFERGEASSPERDNFSYAE